MHHVHFTEIDSTSNWLKRNLYQIPEGDILWVTADTQTMGRGRHGKSWVSKAGAGLWLTYGYWETLEKNTITKLDTPLSLTLAEELTTFFETLGLKTTVKAPNDILVNEKKLCGILCETAWHEDKVACVIGIGINVQSSPKGLDQQTTSLKEEGVTIDVIDLFQKFVLFKRKLSNHSLP